MTANDIGPIARKIIAAGRKQQGQQVVDPQAVRGARDEMRRIIDEAIPSSDVGDQAPGFEKLAAKIRHVEIDWPDDWPVEWIPTDADADAVLDDIPF